jgi:hypothetical protein
MKGHKCIVRSAAALAAAAVLAPAASAQALLTDNSSLTRPPAASHYTPQALKALGERWQAQANAYVASHTQNEDAYIPGVTDFPKPVAAADSNVAPAPAPISDNSDLMAPAQPAPTVSAVPAVGSGFHWSDAAIGGGIGAALAVAGLLAAIAVRGRGRLVQA